MRHFLLSLVFLLGLATPVVAQPEPVDPTPYVHLVEMKTIMHGGSCSGTAIGPYALLTASHCEVPASFIRIDGKRVKILSIERDNYDHSIYFLQMAHPFVKYAPLLLNAKPKLGDLAVLIGNPGQMRNLYRSGQYAGVHVDPDNDQTSWMFNFFTAPGDSGSGIFNSNGEIYGVLSYVENAGDDNIPLWVSMSYPLHFTMDQVNRAQTFTAPPLSEKEANVLDIPSAILRLFLPPGENQ